MSSSHFISICSQRAGPSSAHHTPCSAPAKAPQQSSNGDPLEMPCAAAAAPNSSNCVAEQRKQMARQRREQPVEAVQRRKARRKWADSSARWKKCQRQTAHSPVRILLLLIALATGAAASLMNSEPQSEESSAAEQQIQWEEHTQHQHSQQQPHAAGGDFNTTYISKILNQLTNKLSYDKRLRPRYGKGAVDVGITIHVTSISAVSEVDMDFTLDFYLRQTWYDPRLAYGQLDPELARRIKKLTVGVDYLDRLWKPDTFFPNEKTSVFHLATTHNSFLRIEPDGRIYTSQRLTVKAMCQMELQLFPMDSQICKLGLESYGYDVDDIDYYWGDRRTDGKRPEDAVNFDVFFLPQFRRTGYWVTQGHAVTSSGKYARLYFEVVLTRNLGFYLMNIVIPSMLIVSISWVSFWLSREASPARVGLGVTTVLTMTTLITTTNNSMPKVSYIKGLDVYLNFCFVMVFASLVEYAVVSYWNKRQCRRRDRRERTRSAPAGTASDTSTQMMAPSGQEFPMFMSYPTTPAGGLAIASPNTQSYVYRAPGLLVPTAGMGPTSVAVNPPQLTAQNAQQQQQNTTTAVSIPPECDCRLGNIPLMAYPAELQQQLGVPSTAVPYMMAATNAKMSRRQRRRPYSYYGGMGGFHSASRASRFCKFWKCRSPSKIDRLSRFCFPTLFIVFNLVYWSAMTIMSQRELEKVNFVPFAE